MKWHLSFFVLVFMLSSCSKDKDVNESLSGLVQFKSYNLGTGLRDVLYSNNELKFVATIALSGTRNSFDYTMDYHVLDGTQVITKGTVMVNQNNDHGFGMSWAAAEEVVTINGAALKGKTITVFLDPNHKITMPGYSNQAHELYKKASVEIP